jgi:hypothetical protein
MMSPKLLIAALCLGLVACGPSEEERAAEEARKAAEEMQKAAQEMREAANKAPESIEEAMGQLAQAFGGEAVESVSAKSLKAMLPESWPGMKRVRVSANKNGAMGFTISTAEAEFESLDDDSNETLTIKVSDIGTMQGLARMGLNWLNAEIDEETEDGFSRTTEYNGHKAMENFETRGASATASKLVFVDSRFLVEVKGENVPFKTIDKALDTLPIKELSALANTTSH